MTLSHALDLDADIVELVPYVPGEQAPAEALREIAFRPDAWLPDEIDLLRTLFAADTPIDEIARRLGRGRHGVSTRIYDLGMRRNSTRPWSEWDDAELVAQYSAEPTACLAARLGRSVSAIYARARLLDLTEPVVAYDGWEDAQIRAGYETGIAVAQIASLIGRPISGVIGRASLLGLRHAAQPAGWTSEEMHRTLELAETGMRYLDIIEQLVGEGFPRRTKLGLGPRLRKLGYGRGWAASGSPRRMRCCATPM